MCTEFFQQLGTEQHIAISAPLAALYMNHHALAVDVADFQASQLRVPHASGVERHEKDALVGRTSGVDQLRDFLLAEDRREAMCLFRVGRFGDAPGPVESLAVEKTQSRQAGRDSPRRQLPLLKQLRLIFANLLRPQAVRREIESSSKIFHSANVTARGIFRVITALEFLQHHFSQMGHRDLLVTQTLSQPTSNQRPVAARVASAAGRLCSNAVTGKVKYHFKWTVIRHYWQPFEGRPFPDSFFKALNEGVYVGLSASWPSGDQNSRALKVE